MTPSRKSRPKQNDSNHDLIYQWIEIILSLLVLLFLLFFTYTEIFLKPNMGFRINWNTGIITSTDPVADGFFQINDHVLSINGLSPEKMNESVNENPFIQTPEGEILYIVLIRDGAEVQVHYPKPPQGNQFFLQLISGDWILPYPFLAAGMITVLFIRPRTPTRLLLILFFYAFAVWISAGLISPTGYWASSIIMRVVMWLNVPIAFHLHWRFPIPFKFGKKMDQYSFLQCVFPGCHK